jgi:hypothetical protein
MATTTPNYGWSVPTSTDYVAQGAVAIETLGDSVDSTLFTALGGAYPGLRLVKKQTIGSGVSSVTVTDAFNATYENYKIIITGGVGSVTASIHLQLGTSPGTNYKFGIGYIAYATGNPVSYSSSTGTTRFLDVGGMSTASQNFNVDLHSPFASRQTMMVTQYSQTDVGSVWGAGAQQSTTSFTAFQVATGTGTMTGGTIYVYGYGAS